MSDHRIVRWYFVVACFVGCSNAPQPQHSSPSESDPPVATRESRYSISPEEIGLNARRFTSRTALCDEIEARDKEAYLKLLAQGADPNECDSEGTSAMHLAATQKDTFWLREALKYYGNPNQPNTGNTFGLNDTPIFYAIRAARDQNVLELMAAGADIKHVDDNHCSPLYECVYHRMFSLAIKLIEAGADPSPPEHAHSIFSNGWFDEGYDKTLDIEFPDVYGHIAPGSSRADYFALKKLLIERGYLKQKSE
jgi:ankyrin repeat protein